MEIGKFPHAATISGYNVEPILVQFLPSIGSYPLNKKYLTSNYVKKNYSRIENKY